MNMKIKYLIPILLIVLFFSFVFAGCCFSSGSSTPVESEQDKQITAYTCAKNTVEKMLKAPSTAKFPYIANGEVIIEKLAEDKYFISSYVDSENSFGAMIRITFTVTITLQGEDNQGNTNYEYEDLNINE